MTDSFPIKQTVKFQNSEVIKVLKQLNSKYVDWYIGACVVLDDKRNPEKI